MFVQLLIACGDEHDLDAARRRIEAALDAHPTGTAIVRADVGDEGLSGTLGGSWAGSDLGDWLAVCGPAKDAWDVELLLEAGDWPHTLEDAGKAPSCVTQRLGTFPFEEPSRRGDRALVHVRWRPGQAVAASTWTDDTEATGVPPGLLAQAPPYFRRSPSGRFLRPDRDLFLESPERLRVDLESDVVAGPLADAETWARQLTVPANDLGLVRTALTFDDGDLDDVLTTPDTDAVEEHAREVRGWLRQQTVDGVPLRDAGRVLVVLDVPVGTW